MCPPPDHTPAKLDQIDATTVSLPDSGHSSPKIPAEDSVNGKTHSTVKPDAAPQTCETDAAVMTGETGGLATIHEQSDTASPDDNCGVGAATSGNASLEKTTENGISVHQAPVEPTDVPPKSDSAMDDVDGNEPARLASQPASGVARISAPETASPIIVASAEATGDSEQDAAHTPHSTTTSASDSAQSEEHKFVDPNDKANIGTDVIRFFYTASTRKRPSSPVTTAPGCCNPRLHRDSDLYVKVKGEDGKVYVFEVASATLEKASTKFEAMIYGSHTRGNKEVWVWELDDNPLGLKIMFCLLHNKFPRALVASKPNADQLYKVVQVLEKYEIHLDQTNYHLFAPSWINGFSNGLATSNLSVVEALQVAYAIGDFKTTKTLIREVAHEISDEVGKRIQDFPMKQQDILDSLQKIRNEGLENLLASLKVPLDYFMDANNFQGNRYCRSSEGHFECNQKLLGSLMANLVQQSLFPIPEAASYKGSVATLIAKIEKMEIRGLFYPGVVMTEQKHTLCKLGQAATVEEVKGGKDGKGPLPLSDTLLEYMYFACKRNGLLRQEQKEFEPYKDRIQDFDLLYRDEFQKDIWSWSHDEAGAGDNPRDGSDDSGIFDIADSYGCVKRKVSA
ncbi:hypothetical protein KVR01_005379 [Diaporthe batatas]|uniref:uncharacterized protein n=1 Tax=Diaporthe batatas TaxID=748121 RepID=UPI001D0455CF|nr:uncharacterized protein KVR01_005379 [Diaporthe batatas]KAG8165104.1 hypothetical protein KVR01_005379 [Diaporthe batatas]